MSTRNRIDVSLAEEGRDGEVRHIGVIDGDLEAVAKMVRALRAPNRRLRFVYEAGPCGFGIHRYVTGQGEDCVVVSPSSMPKRSGDRIKTDRRGVPGQNVQPSARCRLEEPLNMRAS